MCATVQSLRNFRPQWFKDGIAHVLFTLERETVPWTKAPSIYQFVKTDEQRKILEYFSSSIEYGRPLLLPPEVPADRVQLIRRAFDATMKDPAFLEEAEKLGMSTLMLASASGPKIAAATPGLSGTWRIEICASSLEKAMPVTTCCSMISLSSQISVPGG